MLSRVVGTLGQWRVRHATQTLEDAAELLPGGVSRHVTAGQAEQVLRSVTPPDAVAAARSDLAAAYIEDLRRIDALQRDARRKLDAAVRASGTSLTTLFGVGQVVAATVIGEVRWAAAGRRVRLPVRRHIARRQPGGLTASRPRRLGDPFWLDNRPFVATL